MTFNVVEKLKVQSSPRECRGCVSTYFMKCLFFIAANLVEQGLKMVSDGET